MFHSVENFKRNTTWMRCPSSYSLLISQLSTFWNVRKSTVNPWTLNQTLWRIMRKFYDKFSWELRNTTLHSVQQAFLTTFLYLSSNPQITPLMTVPESLLSHLCSKSLQLCKRFSLLFLFLYRENNFIFSYSIFLFLPCLSAQCPAEQTKQILYPLKWMKRDTTKTCNLICSFLSHFIFNLKIKSLCYMSWNINSCHISYF